MPDEDFKSPIFRATYVDHKPVKTRSVVQFIFEVTVEQADAALAVLGGFARPSEERWVAIARLSQDAVPETPKALPQVEKPKRSWDDIPYPQQAGILCEDPRFLEFLAEFWPEAFKYGQRDAASVVREYCSER